MVFHENYAFLLLATVGTEINEECWLVTCLPQPAEEWRVRRSTHSRYPQPPAPAQFTSHLKTWLDLMLYINNLNWLEGNHSCMKLYTLCSKLYWSTLLCRQKSAWKQLRSYLLLWPLYHNLSSIVPSLQPSKTCRGTLCEPALER